VLLAFGVFDDGVLDVDEEVDVELFVVDEVSVGCDAPGVVVFGCDCSSVWVSVGVWVWGFASTASTTVTGENDVKRTIAA
jgi:hypothetical protein